jgi:hypothetical protein
MSNYLGAFTMLILGNCSAFSQSVGIGTNTPDNSAMLDITANNKGLLIPSMNLSSINAIINPAKGLLVYDSDSNSAVGSNALFSNSFGSRNVSVGARALSKNTTGYGNSAYGESSLFFNTTGAFNTALGSSALVSNTVSNFNTAVGANAQEQQQMIAELKSQNEE